MIKGKFSPYYSETSLKQRSWDHENCLVITGFSLYQGEKKRNIKSCDQLNHLVVRGFSYIRPLYNEVPLYMLDLYLTSFCACNNVHGMDFLFGKYWAMPGTFRHFRSLINHTPRREMDAAISCFPVQSVMSIPNKPLTSFVQNQLIFIFHKRLTICSQLTSQI